MSATHWVLRFCARRDVQVIGALLLLVPAAISVVQQFRELKFSQRGHEAYEEEWVDQIPVTFAGQRIAFEDSLPRDGSWSDETRGGAAWVLLNDSIVLPPQEARIHIGYPTIGRYHTWITACRFIARDGSDSVMLVGRRRVDGSRDVFDLLTIDAGGASRIERGLLSRRSDDYRRYRVLSGLGIDTPPALPMVLWTWLPGWMLQFFAPWVVLGNCVLFLSVVFARALVASRQRRPGPSRR